MSETSTVLWPASAAKRLTGRGWPEPGAAQGIIWRPEEPPKRQLAERLSLHVSTLTGYAAIRARIAFLMGSDRLAADDAIQVLCCTVLLLYYGYTMALSVCRVP